MRQIVITLALLLGVGISQEIVSISQDLTLRVPPENPVYSLIELDSTGGGMLTVIDRNGKVHRAFKCGDKYLFTGPPGNYLATYLKYADNDWKIVNEPFVIRSDGQGPGDPGDPDPVSYREAIERAMPGSVPFDRSVIYVAFRIGVEKLGAWGGDAVSEQSKIAKAQAQIIDTKADGGTREAWLQFIDVWAAATQALPQSEWEQAWKTTVEVLGKDLQASVPTSYKGSDTSGKIPPVHLVNFTPPTRSILTPLPSTKSSGESKLRVTGPTKPIVYSTSDPAPIRISNTTTPQVVTTSYSANCGQSVSQMNCGQAVVSTMANCTSSSPTIYLDGGRPMSLSGVMQVSPACQATYTTRYTANPLSCGTRYAASNCGGSMQSQMQTCTSMQGASTAAAGCSRGSTFLGGGRLLGRLRGGLIRRSSGQAVSGLSCGQQTRTNWGMR